MQHYTTVDGRIGRRTYLKTLGAGALATGMAGVAGCLGAGSGGSGGSDGETGTDAESGASGGTSSGDSGDSNPGTEEDSSSGAASIDVSGFETYTHDDPTFTIKHPPSWAMEDNEVLTEIAPKNDAVAFFSGSIAYHSGFETPEELKKQVNNRIKRKRRQIKITDGNKLEDKTVTLPSGQTGTTLGILHEGGDSSTQIFYVGAGDTVYIVICNWRVDDAPKDFRRTADAVIESLTIEE